MRFHADSMEMPERGCMGNQIRKSDPAKKERRRAIWKHIIKKYILITIGTAIYATGIGMLLDPNRLAPGGVSGIAIILSKFTPLMTGTWILLFNIPLLVVGFWKFGRSLMLGTLYATVLSSLFTNLFSTFTPLSNDLIVAAALGGLCTGTGIGLVFRAGATTGGMDIVVKLLRIRYPYLKSGTIFLVLDLIVVSLSGFVFGNLTLAVYAGLVVLLSTHMMNLILYGQDEARVIYIISDRYNEIAERAMEEENAGVTFLNGSGAYTSRDKRIIFCVLRKQSAVRVIDIVKEEDPQAFLIVSSASEVFGIGYKNIRAERL